ncbi:MAG: hypothetical protein ABIH11_00555 [Candidatus Altiarchaeota archaeon]
MTDFKLKEAYELLLSDAWIFTPTLIIFIIFLLMMAGLFIGFLALIFNAIAGLDFLYLFIMFLAWILVFMVVACLSYQFIFIMTSVLARNALSGGKAGSDFFIQSLKANTVKIVMASVAVTIANIFLSLTMVGPIILGFILYFAPFYMAKGEGVFESFSKSYRFVRENLREVLIIYLLYFGGIVISAYLMYLPLLFFIPWIIVLSQFYFEDRLESCEI